MNLDLSKIKNVHFIGIGGIGISAIARMMIHNGKKVSGQDMQEGEVVKELKKVGASITIGQSFSNIPEGTDLIVYTIAIDTYDPDLALKIKTQTEIPIRSYPEMLDIISRDKYTIAVSGTHGKTTTTAMIAQILRGMKYDPTVIVGSLLTGDSMNDGQGKSNFIAGNSKYFVVEACEYRRSFLNINPKILIITNIDNDHLDYYKDIEDIKSAFREMIARLPVGGYVICNPNDKYIGDVIKNTKAKIINWEDFFDSNLNLKIPGIHNKKNAAAAIAVADILGISKSDSKKYLAEFLGTWKRFEFKGNISQGSMVYDDYAHHPTEIKASLDGFRELYSKDDGWKLTVIFQPHLFSRTKLLLDDFAKSFSDADNVILLPIYHAREVDNGTISSEILANEINKNTNNSKAFINLGDVEIYLKNNLSNMNEKDIVITMGAGEASKVGDFLLE
ncbi:MAG: Mur ligase family protein [Candidatus Nomurabacteria bacterium]|nr:Mur ligase family protein [Candidatus Nomurabacteria bacterium]